MSAAAALGGAGVVGVVALAAPQRPQRRRSTLPSAAGMGISPHPHPHETLLSAALDALHLDADPVTTLTALRAATAVAVVGALLVGGLATAMLVGTTAIATPRVTQRVLAVRASRQRDEQLAPMLELLAADLRAGSALGPAFVAVAHRTPAPLGDELRGIAAEVEHGAGLSHALDHWEARAPAGTPVRLVAAALTLAAEAGGEVARSVDQVAATVRERRDLRAEVRALATQARASAAVLVATPLGFAALVAGIEPSATAFLVTSPAGALCLSAGLGLDALGAVWMARILRETQ